MCFGGLQFQLLLRYTLARVMTVLKVTAANTSIFALNIFYTWSYLSP